MKKIILIATSILALSLTVNAQEKPKDPAQKKARLEKQQNTVDQRAQRSVNNLNAEVSLSQEQQVKVKELAIVRIKKVDEAKMKYKDQADKQNLAKTEIEAARKEYRSGVKSILTADQIKVLSEKRKAQKHAKEAAKSEEIIEIAE
jgi:hypothetical protein